MNKKKEIEILKGFIEKTETEIMDKELEIANLQIEISGYTRTIRELKLDKSI